MDQYRNQNKELKEYLYSLAYKYKVYLISLVVIAISAGSLNIFVNYSIKEIIDTIGVNPNTEVIFLILLFILYKLMYHGMYFIFRLFDIKYKPAMLAEIVESSYVKTMKHSLHWFDSHLSGEIASKVTDLQDSIITIISMIFRSLSNLSVMMIGIVFLLTVNYIAASVLIGFVVIYVPVLTVLLKKQMVLQEEYAKARQESIGIINDSISNVFGIKIIGNLSTELKMKFLPAIAKWASWDKKTRQYDAYYVDMADTILVTIMGAVQISLIAYLYKIGQITAGDFAFIAMITLNIHKELEGLLENILFSINPKIAMMKSSYRFMSTVSDFTDKNDSIVLSNVRGDIEYKNVTFSYNNDANDSDNHSANERNNTNIFNNFNLHIKSGQRIGIVGTSGAGKTTLIKCLLKYFQLQNGQILVDGFDISKVTAESLRANVSVIPQDITMFHRSILENLQLAKYDADFEEIKSACRKAKIADDIEKMPQGYNSIVGERGVKVSGGQRQRIAIARAILKNAPILILDEATSALDTPTEKLIQESINEVLNISNATTIVIAHRLSTLLNMDRIIVFDSGKIVEDGTHTELLAHGVLYKTLWDSQVGGFISDKKSED